MVQKKRRWAVIGAVVAIIPAWLAAGMVSFEGNDVITGLVFGGTIGIGVIIALVIAEIVYHRQRQG